MERPDWRPEGYRPCAPLTEEEHAVIRRALEQLRAGELVVYSMGCDYHFSSGGTAYGGASCAVTCEGEAAARAEVRRRFASWAERNDDAVFWIRRVGPPYRGFRPPGIEPWIELRPGLMPGRADEDRGPRIYLDPVQPDLFAAL